MGYLKKTIGFRFLCIREVVFGLCDVKYRKGKIYKSEVEGCITNEDGEKNHEWIEYPEDTEWRGVFRINGNKRRSGRR
jgi:hypothetical protein